MTLADIYKKLSESYRPIEFFGDVDEIGLKKRYRVYLKVCHPDSAPDSDYDLALKTTMLLNQIYTSAIQEIRNHTYAIINETDLLKSKKVLFQFDFKDNNYKFYDYYASEDVSDLYLGLCEDKEVILKIPIENNDSDLIDNEYNMLSRLKHLGFPKIIGILKINGKTSLMFEKGNEISLERLKKDYGNIPDEHICWILERLLSVVGYLHSEKIVHGNIKAENILIDVANHNVILKDYTLSINKANEYDKRYKIINDYYTPVYVNDSSIVIPNVDIYAIGIVAIYLMGGDIKRKAMPTTCDIDLRKFIRKMLQDDQNDAWELWNQLIKLRNDKYGIGRFKILKKIR